MRIFLTVLMLWPGLSLGQMNEADVVILGEVHDNPAAHLGQAQALKELTPNAVVFEMLSAAAAEAANSVRPSDIAAVTGWADSGWPDFALYAPIFEALGHAQIVGAAPLRVQVRAAFADGAFVIMGPDGRRFGLDQSLSGSEQAMREALQSTAHCDAMPQEAMSGMVEAQRFRDAAFAAATLAALRDFGAPVAVITGNAHARTDWGVPAMIASASPDTTVYSIAFAETPPDAPYDEVRLVPIVDRSDSCGQFSKKK